MKEKHPNKPKTMKIPIIASVSLSILIIVIILYYTFDPETFKYLSSVSIRYEFFLIAILLNIVYFFLWGLRLKILSNAIDKNVRISFLESTKIVLANLFLGSITPSMAGGEPVRIYLLNKNGMKLGSATASVLGERLLDAVFMLVAVPFAFFIFKDKINIELISWGLTVGVIFFTVLLVFFLYALRNPLRIKSFLIYLNGKVSKFLKKEKQKSGVINRINREVDSFHGSMKRYAGKEKKAFVTAGLLTILFWSTGFMIPSMILMGLNLPPFFIESYAAQVLLLIIIMMPTTPGSTGVAEGGVAGLYAVIIGSSYDYLIGVFVLLFRFVTYHLNLIIGTIFQYRIFKAIASFSLENIRKDEITEEQV